MVPTLTLPAMGEYTFAQLLNNYGVTVSQTPSLLSIEGELLKSLNPIPQVKEAFSGVDSSGKPVGVGRRIIDGGMAASTTISIATGAGLQAKAGFFVVEREALDIGASTSLKRLSAESSVVRHTGSGLFSGSADEAYSAIRSTTIDVKARAENTGVKVANIEKVKNHLFYQDHLLDQWHYLKRSTPANSII